MLSLILALTCAKILVKCEETPSPLSERGENCSIVAVQYSSMTMVLNDTEYQSLFQCLHNRTIVHCQVGTQARNTSEPFMNTVGKLMKDKNISITCNCSVSQHKYFFTSIYNSSFRQAELSLNQLEGAETNSTAIDLCTNSSQ
ncbi:unnamed protein product, partial [Lymnaea stagnalis]